MISSSVPSSHSKGGTNFELSWGRLKIAFNAKSDTDLARALSLGQGAVSTAKTRRKIPPAWYITAAQLAGVSVDWLLTGEGPMRRGEAAISGASPPNSEEQPADLASQLVEEAAKEAGVPITESQKVAFVTIAREELKIMLRQMLRVMKRGGDVPGGTNTDPYSVKELS